MSGEPVPSEVARQIQREFNDAKRKVRNGDPVTVKADLNGVTRLVTVAYHPAPEMANCYVVALAGGLMRVGLNMHRGTMTFMAHGRPYRLKAPNWLGVVVTDKECPPEQ